MRKYLLSAVLVVAAAALFGAAPSALAQTTGYLEICKHSDPTAPVSGPIHFTIDGTIGVNVPTGGCSAALQVPSGTATVVEQPEAYYAETAASTIPQGALVSSNLVTGTQEVTVTASADVSTATTLNVTNKEVTGTLEVCKSAQEGSGLTGNFTFRVIGAFGFVKTLTVPVGACSQSFTVPAGAVEVDETGTNNTDVVAISTVRPADLLFSDLAARLARVRIVSGGVGDETIVTFVNSTSRLKICKIAGTDALRGTVYSFTANGATVTAVAGAAPGNCVLVPTPFPGGTRVNIQEGIVAGTGVQSIAVSDNRQVPGTIDLNNRSVSVILGSGETIVTYTDVAVSPGLLKVCKNAGTGVTVGQLFTFHIGTQTLQVPAGYCAIAGTFPFNSTQTITEDATAGLSVTAESVDPASELVSESLSGRVINAMIGAGVTEVSFTNATTGTAATAPSTGSGTGATTTAPTTVPTTTSPVVVKPTPVVEPTIPAHRCIVVARLVFVRVNGLLQPELVLRLRGNATVCNVLLREFNGQGVLIAHTTRTLHSNRVVRLLLSHHVARVRAVVVK